MATKGSFQEGSIPAILDAAADDALRKFVNDSELPGSWAARAAIEGTDIIDAELRELHGKPPTGKSAVKLIKRVNLYTNPMTSAAYTAYMTSGIKPTTGGSNKLRVNMGGVLVVGVVVVVVVVVLSMIIFFSRTVESFGVRNPCQPKATRFSPREALGGNSNNMNNVTVAARTKNIA